MRIPRRALSSILTKILASKYCEYMRQESCCYESAPMPEMSMDAAEEEADALGVTIEAEYEVGEYDILILSAEESEGLITWLNSNGYKIPDGAEEDCELLS